MTTKNNKIYLPLIMLLGDGWIQNGKIGKEYSYNSERANLLIAHHSSQLEYLKWKKDLLEKAGYEVTLGEKRKSDAPNQFYIRTKTSKLIASVRNSVMVNKKKVFKKEWIYHLDDLALAIIWMDDGHLGHQVNKNKQYVYHVGEIATHGFDYESNQNICYWLKKRFNIDSYIVTKRYKDKEDKYYIKLNRDNLHKLLSVVSPYVSQVESMSYKLDCQTYEQRLK